MTMINNAVVEEDIHRILASDLPWWQLSGKSLLVTGAGGVIGRYLVWTIIILNKRLEIPVKIYACGRNCEQLREILGTDKNLKCVRVDLSSGFAIDMHCDFIIHAASYATTKQHREDPVGTFAPNVFGTRSLLEMAKRSQSSGFLFVSSCAVYGQPKVASEQTIVESTTSSYDHLDLSMSYAEGKRAGEVLCYIAANLGDAPVTIARLGHTYGPGLLRSDERIFADFVYKILDGKNLKIRTAGSAVRPFCYLSDAISGIFTILLKGKGGEAYNLVNTRAECSILDLANQLCEEFKEYDLQVEIGSQQSHSFQEVVHFSTKKLEDLGWTPKINVREGFRRTVNAHNNYKITRPV